MQKISYQEKVKFIVDTLDISPDAAGRKLGGFTGPAVRSWLSGKAKPGPRSREPINKLYNKLKSDK